MFRRVAAWCLALVRRPADPGARPALAPETSLERLRRQIEEGRHLRVVRQRGEPTPRRRWKWLLAVAVIRGGGVLLWREYVVHEIEPHPGEVDPGEKSSDLPRDLRLMWETQKLGGTPDPTHDPNPRCSTDRAINAASRVFNTAELVGKTQEEVVELLGDPKSSSDSIYNFPFWSAPRGALVYRFSSGAYGWQFNVLFGADGRVREVERHWIH